VVVFISVIHSLVGNARSREAAGRDRILDDQVVLERSKRFDIHFGN